MDCLHACKPLVESSSPTFAAEQFEKATIKKIHMLVAPRLFPDWRGATSLIKDPFGEAINLAKMLTATKKENALVYIIGHFPAASSDRAYQTLDLIEAQENRKKAIEKIHETQFRTFLAQKEFASAKLILSELPIGELYYHWLFVIKSLECVQVDKALDCIKNIDLLEETFNFVKNIPESFHSYPDMSKMLQEICDKFLLTGNLEKALIVARMLEHNEEMRDKQLRKIGDEYLKLKKIESVYALLNEIKSSFDVQWLKEGLCYAHFKRGEAVEGLRLVKEIDDELIWIDVRMNLESFIEEYRTNGQEQLSIEIQQTIDEQEKTLNIKCLLLMNK